VRFAIAILLLTSACFPDSARHRRYAKIGEGLLVAGGIALNYLSKAGACMERRPGTLVEDCDRSVAQLDNLGLIMIFSGLVGFAATTLSGQQGSDPDVDDDAPDAPQESGVFAAPAAFCPSLWAGKLPEAEAALSTYVKSVGATGLTATEDALHAWLSRQPCVTVEDNEEDASVLSIRIRVSVREQFYRVEFSASPMIVLIAD
jgi:hypothetical protein